MIKHFITAAVLITFVGAAPASAYPPDVDPAEPTDVLMWHVERDLNRIDGYDFLIDCTDEGPRYPFHAAACLAIFNSHHWRACRRSFWIAPSTGFVRGVTRCSHRFMWVQADFGPDGLPRRRPRTPIWR